MPYLAYISRKNTCGKNTMQSLEFIRKKGKILNAKVPHFTDVSNTWSCSGSIFTSFDTEHVQIQPGFMLFNPETNT